jgi:hypothetical protein
MNSITGRSCAHLVGVKDGCLPEHCLDTSHASEDVFHLKTYFLRFFKEQKKQSYLDVTNNSVTMLGFLQAHDGQWS